MGFKGSEVQILSPRPNNIVSEKAFALHMPFPDSSLWFCLSRGCPLITVYVLKGETGKRYVGITNDLSRRFKEHRNRYSKAGQIIGKFTVIYTESFTDHKSARIKEKFLKSGQGRKWLDKLDAGSEPATKPAGKARL
jgi:putative endonuclease